MDSKLFLDTTGYADKVAKLRVEHAAQLWNLGTEVIILATLSGDANMLGRVATEANRHIGNTISLTDPKITMQLERLGAGAILSKTIEASSASPDIIEKLRSVPKYTIETYQASQLPGFFERHVGDEGGEATVSFNKRAVRNLTEVLYPLSSRLERVRVNGDTIPHYEFSLDGRVLPDWQHEPACNKELTDLHSSLLEYDTLMALYHMVIKYQLPYIPVLAGVASEQHNNLGLGRNMNADILLIHEDGSRVIPIQVKIDDHWSHGRYDETYIVIVDSKTLMTWSTKPGIQTNPRGGKAYVDDIVYASGDITAKMSAAYKKYHGRPHVKHIPEVDRAADQLYNTINQNPLHTLAT